MISGVIHAIHRLPGRIRLYVGEIRFRPERAAYIASLIRAQNGIKECTANAKTGTILVYYEQSSFSEQVVIEMVKNVSYKSRTEAVPAQQAGRKKVFELEDLSISTQVTMVAAGGLTLLAQLVCFLAKRRVVPWQLAAWTNLITLLTALPILRSGMEGLFRQRKLNNEFLIATAILLSLLLKEGLTGLVVVWLVNVSTLAETVTLDRSRRAIRGVLEGDEKHAWIVANGQERRIPTEQLKQKDIVSVKIGARIPVDGRITEGEAVVNQAALTGEPIAVFKKRGDQVLAGSMIEQGTLYICAEKVGDQTSVARIIHLVEQATHARAPIQKAADRYSARIIPASFLLAFVVFLLTRDIRRTMTILIVACPCAAGLATPTALSAAIGNAASRGILVKGGRYLEEAGRINCLLFDKTGTLTEGKPVVSKIVSLHPHYNARAVLTLAAAAEANANHPLASAIQEAATQAGITLPCLPNSEMAVGRGVKAIIDGVPVYVGNSRYLKELQLTLPDAAELDDLRQTATFVYVASGKEVIGILAIEDALRANAITAIRSIREEGITDIGIVTGDNSAVAQETARRLGIERVWSAMLPEDKYALIQDLQQQGRIIGMAGDGVNDSPSLALANVGIAMGVGGADAAIDTAGIVLREDNPERIVEVVRLGKRSLTVIRQNFLFAIGANIVGLGLGTAKLISPFWAAVLHNASTLAVVLNSTRLLSYSPEQRPVVSQPETNEEDCLPYSGVRQE